MSKKIGRPRKTPVGVKLFGNTLRLDSELRAALRRHADDLTSKSDRVVSVHDVIVDAVKAHLSSAHLSDVVREAENRLLLARAELRDVREATRGLYWALHSFVGRHDDMAATLNNAKAAIATANGAGIDLESTADGIYDPASGVVVLRKANGR